MTLRQLRPLPTLMDKIRHCVKDNYPTSLLQDGWNIIDMSSALLQLVLLEYCSVKGRAHLTISPVHPGGHWPELRRHGWMCTC